MKNKKFDSISLIDNIGGAFYDGALLGFFAMLISGTIIGAVILTLILFVIGYLLKKKAKKLTNTNSIKTWNCYYCGHTNEGKVCKSCNKKRKVCKKCGFDIEKETLYCSKCGKKVK